MRTLLSWVLCGFCMGWVSVAAQIAQQPFTLSISAEAPAIRTGLDRYTVKAGSEVFIAVHLTNVSKHNLELSVDQNSRTGVNFAHQYEVRDIDGNFAKKRTISHPEFLFFHGWPARVLESGKSMDFNGDRISGLYDLSQPGQYAIQLSRGVGDNPKNGLVKSNTITITVTK